MLFNVYFDEYKRFLKSKGSFTKQFKKDLKYPEVRMVLLFFIVWTIFIIVSWIYPRKEIIFIGMVFALWFFYYMHTHTIDKGFESEIAFAKRKIDKDVRFLGDHKLLTRNHIDWFIKEGKEHLSSNEWMQFITLTKTVISNFIIPLVLLFIPSLLKAASFEEGVTICGFVITIVITLYWLVNNIAHFINYSVGDNVKLRQLIDSLEYILLDFDFYVNKYNQMKKDKQ